MVVVLGGGGGGGGVGVGQTVHSVCKIVNIIIMFKCGTCICIISVKKQSENQKQYFLDPKSFP